ncbi:Sodium/glucose cotransporter [Pedobacter sp. Bi27]|uniref:sodium/sugar symporter n=1 Tax=unclassified Pedobacter TaxID=2628915 RepID=UPI001DF2D799|nr:MULTISPECIES: sodium/sugar symporter [unclassified Pedobacter]CAH0194940.1 Sodium/glucose cotransporter [Pedobacter sp. Bi36]CAH0250574.1 Sodium/glucose cotransporter [Pedobacter sp. Bi126]CAH0306034.1 Sodium/glucose cotransporter [Pedobacter sp. Bi27]
MKNNLLDTKDYIVFAVYFVIVAAYGLYIYNKKKSASTGSKDYFLAEGSLTWWAIGASLIASNISAEQFIGMSGSGFKMGLAIATYEWMAALTLVIVAVFFIPVYLKNKIATMPQFLHQRYNGTVAMIMAVFWLLLYVVVNLTSILYLGALAVSSISGFDLTFCMYAIAAFAIVITLGGMKVIGYTDVIQVFFLILGGLATTYLALNLVSTHYGTSGIFEGYSLMTSKASEHFHMILKPDNENYIDLPGLSVLVGGMWIVNLNYWGCNQYITQRALGADLKTARGGILFAAFLKLLMPIIVVLPGIAAYVLYKDGAFQSEMLQDGTVNPDRAYPVLLNLLPAGLKGLSFAALTAAVVASLAGKANSIATIFTLDIYKKVLKTDASEKNLVFTGKIAVVVAMALGVIIAPHLGIDKKGGFQYIQEYTGFVSPGIFAMFILGFFWKRATSNAALFATIGGFGLSLLLKVLPTWTDLSWLSGVGFSVKNATGIYEIPFLDRMGIVFVFCIIGMVIISLFENKNGVNPKGLEIDSKMFKTTTGFAVGSLIIIGLLVALYSIYW